MATELLKAIAAVLGDLVNPEVWPGEIEEWGEQIVLYRRYIDGRHRLDLEGTKMAASLRIDEEDEGRFSINYMPLVANSMSNRLHIERIDAIIEPVVLADKSAELAENTRLKKLANDWMSDYLINSDFDETQNDVNRDAVSDGDTFVMLEPPKGDEMGSFVHEPAWDNSVGVIPVYGERGRQMVAAVKVWIQTDGQERVNIYYEDRVDKFVNSESGFEKLPGDDRKWQDADGTALGVPFGHYRNDKLTRNWHGKSRIAPTIPPQDILNRTFMSMSLTSDNTAFQRGIAFGFEVGEEVAPGSVWTIIDKEIQPDGSEVAVAGLPAERYFDWKLIEPGELSPFIQQATLTIEQISITGNTPISTVSGGGDKESGEALKQRESGLLAEGKTNQVVFGNVWNRLIMMAWKAEVAFNPNTPPDIKRANSVWASIEVRNDVETIDNIVKMKDDLSRTKRMELTAPVLGYDVDEIPGMIIQIEAENVDLINRFIRNGNNGRADRTPPPATETETQTTTNVEST